MINRIQYSNKNGTILINYYAEGSININDMLYTDIENIDFIIESLAHIKRMVKESKQIEGTAILTIEIDKK